ncbi:MAG: M3 family metallopeptidase [Candidatus Sericytochromatia bacterium]|nr:M3 family metallopeptidase [Candidatus Sericytochromatia bacterium]
MSVAQSEELTRWDLREYYSGPDDPKIEQDLAHARHLAIQFRQTYHARVEGLSVDELHLACEQFDEVGARLSDLADYAFLSFCLDTRDEKSQALNARLQGETSVIRGETNFFVYELQHLSETLFGSFCEAAALAPWRDHLRRLRRQAPHALSDEVAKVVTRKEQSGVQAWRQLYTTVSLAKGIILQTADEVRSVTPAEANRLTTSPDRVTRRLATEAIANSLVNQRDVISAVMNAITEDARINADLRGYSLPYSELLLDERIDEGAIETVLSTVEARYDLVHRYMALKARALGISDFAAWDIQAPLGDEPLQYSFAQARRIVHDAYSGFSPRLGRYIDRFFDGGYIDAAPAPGKWAGAFCSWSTPGRHPYVCVNYTNRIRDVLTLAHELGHGVHYRVTGEVDRYMNLRSGLFSETPSTLGELLTFERLVAEAPSDDARRALLGAWLDTTVGTLFLQVGLTRWEQQIHALRRRGPLSAEILSNLWMAQRRAVYGPGVYLPDWLAWGWLVHHHAFGMPFYCLNYPIGLTMVYALRQRWREEGAKFADDFMGLLAAGLAPGVGDLLGKIGEDPLDVSFWQKGLAAVESLIDDFEATLA